MSATKITLGQAIDQVITALEALDEDARVTAVAAACAHLNLKMLPESGVVPPALQPGHMQMETAHHADARHGKRADIRSLKEEKDPGSAKQMACLVAYYLQEAAPEGERKVAISSQDIDKYFETGWLQATEEGRTSIGRRQTIWLFRVGGSRRVQAKCCWLQPSRPWSAGQEVRLRLYG